MPPPTGSRLPQSATFTLPKEKPVLISQSSNATVISEPTQIDAYNSTMPKFLIGQAELYYTVSGNHAGDWLLLIPGFASDTSTWALMLPELIQDYRILRLDNRGIGQSSTSEHEYRVTDLAQDIAVLLEHLGINAVHVAGHSLGGQIAQELVFLAPEKVKSLILLATWAMPDPKFQALMQLLGDLATRLEMRFYLKSLVHWLFSQRFFATPQAINQIFQGIDSIPNLPSPQELAHQSQAIIQSNTISRLVSIHCPTLILHGDQDLITPIKFAHQLAQGIPQAQFAVLPETGHGSIIESSQLVTGAMLAFLESLKGEGSKP
ncbi:alpha/beta fold hydrolase [Synechococcus sp. PCC 6312]|uniref:alpha/beta fold hydrolase n=1 Tax=Synechococcus sp. (strain ATCC 27167 / PCC 6312) TaxID=195253 RepID=UPI00029EEA70|nr:alpha/beta hydrolase [Synechococcus sp. PCC 6312]AFY62721.1 putative hydrolase or acyltransferase of alpha/beta superfamily [Synechococcus sp. PCC 6312]